jgi:hypothetical protein
MIATLSLDVPTRAKQTHSLRQVTPLWPVLRDEAWSDLSVDLCLDVEGNFVGVCGVLKGLISLLRDKSVEVKFREEEVTRLRGMAEGLQDLVNELARQLERRSS